MYVYIRRQGPKYLPADTLAATYLASATTTASSVAEGAASRKDNKYSAIAQSHVFVPLVLETLRPINFKNVKFEIGRCVVIFNF